MRLVAGPGCPVCVTAMADLDRVIALARLPEVTLATFGDLIRVPASRTTLAAERAAGADVRVVYSPRDAVRDRRRRARAAGRLRRHRLRDHGADRRRGPARGARARPRQLLGAEHAQDDAAAAAGAARRWARRPSAASSCPGHVSVVTGTACYEFLAARVRRRRRRRRLRAARRAAGAAACSCGRREPAIEIEYSRAVRPEGNVVAQRLHGAGLRARRRRLARPGRHPRLGAARCAPEFADVDAALRFAVEPEPPLEPAGCRCGEVLRGVIDPAECALFGARCTPEDPVGACMVSSEGACAARYRYRGDR